MPAPVIFFVTNGDGIEAGYEGVFAELRPFTVDRFVELAPGESTEATFDLAEGYFMPAGEYTVIASYRNSDDGSQHGLNAFITGDADFHSAPVTIEVN